MAKTTKKIENEWDEYDIVIYKNGEPQKIQHFKIYKDSYKVSKYDLVERAIIKFAKERLNQ